VIAALPPVAPPGVCGRGVQIRDPDPEDALDNNAGVERDETRGADGRGTPTFGEVVTPLLFGPVTPPVAFGLSPGTEGSGIPDLAGFGEGEGVALADAEPGLGEDGGDSEEGATAMRRAPTVVTGLAEAEAAAEGEGSLFPAHCAFGSTGVFLVGMAGGNEPEDDGDDEEEEEDDDGVGVGTEVSEDCFDI